MLIIVEILKGNLLLKYSITKYFNIGLTVVGFE